MLFSVNELDDDIFENLGPAWINRIRWEIEENNAQLEDVELMMKYFSNLYHSEDGFPHKHLREYLKLFDQVFKEYFNRKSDNQMYGNLDAAFGLTRKQGDRNLDKRNEDIATDLARHHVLNGDSITNATMKISSECNLKKTTIEKAWKVHKMMAIHRLKIELKNEGRGFTPEQLKRALKIEDRENRYFNNYIKNPGK